MVVVVVVVVVVAGGGHNVLHGLAKLLLMLGPPVLEPNLHPRRVQVRLARQGLAKTRTRVAVLLEGPLEHIQLILVECRPVALLVDGLWGLLLLLDGT